MLFRMERYYTGIGSRSTPADVCTRMFNIARLCYHAYFLRSGGARGADQSFEAGANDRCRSYLPTDTIPEEAFILGRQFYEPHLKRTFNRSWAQTKPFTKRLMARNVLQVLGDDLNTPSEFVVCWTPDGCESHLTRTKDTGGTGQAIAVASTFQIEVINLHNEDSLPRLRKILGDYECLT